jgi:hypothetical protein
METTPLIETTPLMIRANSTFREAKEHRGSHGGGIQGFFSRLLMRPQQLDDIINDNNFKIRKCPLKIEPKVFFANERTFLSWMHTSTFLSAAAMGIIAYADDNPWSQVYGLTLLPVALGFIVYSMTQCKQPTCLNINISIIIQASR